MDESDKNVGASSNPHSTVLRIVINTPMPGRMIDGNVIDANEPRGKLIKKVTAAARNMLPLPYKRAAIASGPVFCMRQQQQRHSKEIEIVWAGFYAYRHKCRRKPLFGKGSFYVFDNLCIAGFAPGQLQDVSELAATGAGRENILFGLSVRGDKVAVGQGGKFLTKAADYFECLSLNGDGLSLGSRVARDRLICTVDGWTTRQKHRLLKDTLHIPKWNYLFSKCVFVSLGAG